MKIYSCEIKGSAAALDAYFNEYHLYASAGASHSYATSLKPWMEKENLFRIVVTPSGKARAGDAVRFSVAATLTEGSQRRSLVKMQFPEGVAPPHAPSLPFDTMGKNLATGNNLSFVCDDPGDVVAKPWKATPRTIDDPRQAYQLYGQIQALFVAGDIEQIMAISRARISFGARLHGLARADYEKEILNDLKQTLAGHPQWRTVSDPERELTVHEFMPRKVVRMLNLRGFGALRTAPDKDGIQFGYDVILAMTPEGLVWIM